MEANKKSFTVTITYTVTVTPEQVATIRGWDESLTTDEAAAVAEARVQVAHRTATPSVTVTR